MKTLYVTILFLVFPLLLQAQWHMVQNSSTEGLTAIRFVSNTTGFTCGGGGAFLKTTDGGVSWQALHSGITPSLASIDATDEQHIFMGRAGFYATRDGIHFEERGGLGDFFGTIFAIKAFDTSRILIIKEAGILESLNGGHSWNVMYNTNDYPRYMQFTGNDTGYVGGGISYDGMTSGSIHRTTDGGHTWSDLHINSQQVTAMHFVNSATGYYAGFVSDFYKTTDGGNTWNMVNSDLDDYITGLHFLTEEEGYATTASGHIWKTTNGGQHWVKDYHSSAETALNAIGSTPDKSLFAIGNDGLILTNKNIVSTKEIKQEAVKIYPNPTTDYLVIDLKDVKHGYAGLELYNCLGRLVLQQVFDGRRQQYKLDVSSCSKGLHLLKLKTATGSVYTEKIMVR